MGASIALAAGIGALGSVGGALIGSSASKSSSQTQANSADKAAQLQYQEFEQTQANEQPWLKAGQVGLSQLMSGLQPGGYFSTPYSGTFTAPTAEEARATPGYQFTQSEGEKAIERGASASGGAITGGTEKSLEAFDTGLADQTYQQTFQNKLNEFMTQFNTYNTNQSNLYNKLASVSNLGQTTATQLGQLGQQSATAQGGYLTSGAAAQAAGTVGAANAYTSGLQGLTNNASGYLNLQALLNGGGNYTGPAANAPIQDFNIQPPTYPSYDINPPAYSSVGL